MCKQVPFAPYSCTFVKPVTEAALKVTLLKQFWKICIAVALNVALTVALTVAINSPINEFNEKKNFYNIQYGAWLPGKHHVRFRRQ